MLATHYCVFMQWSLAKQHLFNQVEGSPQSVTEDKLKAKGEGWRPVRPLNYNFNMCRWRNNRLARRAVSEPEEAGMERRKMQRKSLPELGARLMGSKGDQCRRGGCAQTRCS